MRHRSDGFTLIELMSVVCIIGVLALVSYPAYRSHVLKAKRTEARSALVRAMQQQERHFSRHNRYHPYSNAAEAGPFTWFSGDTAATSAYRISAAACAGTSILECVDLSAEPGAASVDTGYSDAQCGTLTFNSMGEWSVTGLPSASAPSVCR